MDEEKDSVVAYRLGALEATLKAFTEKIDTLLTRDMLNLILAPYIADLEELKSDRQTKDIYKGQLKIALAAAIVSPVMSAILTALVIVNLK